MRRALLSLTLFGGVLAGCGSEHGDQRPQRIVLITLDTLRADVLGPSRAGDLMPATAALAADGLFFDNFFATTSTTQPSHATLFTGRYPWAHGVTRNGIVMEGSNQTLAEELQTHGYATHAVVSSFPLHERFGFAQGFDQFEDDFDEPYVQVWEGQPTEEGRFFSLAQSVTDKALAAIERAGSGDQFFWFHYFDPHDPYGDTPLDGAAAGRVSVTQLLNFAASGNPEVHALLEKARRLYDRDIQGLDRSLGQLYARLAEDADAFDTHILVTADHGESFGEQGAIGHGKRVTREQVQVPLVIHSPRVEPEVRGDAASLIDVAGTILTLVRRPSGAFGGRDLIRAPSTEAPEVFGMRRSFSSPKGEITLTGNFGPLPETWYFTVRGRRLLGGNADHLLEEDDRARPLVGEEYRELLEIFGEFDGFQATGVVGTELLDEEAQRALRALGYTDSTD